MSDHYEPEKAEAQCSQCSFYFAADPESNWECINQIARVVAPEAFIPEPGKTRCSKKQQYQQATSRRKAQNILELLTLELLEPGAVDATSESQKLWERTEKVARVLHSEAFLSNVEVRPHTAAVSYFTRLKHLRTVAIHEAHRVLVFLGRNTDNDWLFLLQRIAEEDIDRPSSQVHPSMRDHLPSML